ncbi:MAG: 1,2-phenylacetyl-CoA epoxidase subunit PaaD [Actinomycetota bacterium]
MAAIVHDVPDPELPHVTIGDLGIVRDVAEVDGRIDVTITPTFTGCPATEMISEQIVERLRDHGVERATVTVTLSPAWSTDWITDRGRARLRRAGIAPPTKRHDADLDVVLQIPAECPRCGSRRTRAKSEFGSTPCKALSVCLACGEAFERFKPI